MPAHSPTPTSTQLTRVTFRVRGVPRNWDTTKLESFLASLGNSPGFGLTVGSLAAEVNGRSCTATVDVQSERSWKAPAFVPRSNQSDPQMALDDRFLGITPIYTPSEEHHKLDIIGISGLGGHAFGSFKQRGGEHMWLRDALPYGITGEDGRTSSARVMIYGYESGLVESQNTQNIEDLAISFHDSLLPLITGTVTPKPIVLIAHSLGGLVVKQALINLSKSRNHDHQRLLAAVYGVVFFGVLHDGMDIRSLVPMVENGPNRFLLESIGNISSQVLTMQQREFPQALGEDKSEVICFFETLMSPTAVVIDGKWQMKGPPAVLVNKSSATHCRPWENGPEHICPIDRNHSNMVKFGPHDHEYEKALARIQGVSRRALVSGK
ncbi:hypothetical protein B0I37DRAFT_373108 [Chaetomium sp. MPI-CAGE-AT-0009]|nr:hypothetical protein B0I37DRAFT_373108 [Chaetomium sp. MPI-CAGE-AT-0009]